MLNSFSFALWIKSQIDFSAVWNVFLVFFSLIHTHTNILDNNNDSTDSWTKFLREMELFSLDEIFLADNERVWCVCLIVLLLYIYMFFYLHFWQNKCILNRMWSVKIDERDGLLVIIGSVRSTNVIWINVQIKMEKFGFSSSSCSLAVQNIPPTEYRRQKRQRERERKMLKQFINVVRIWMAKENQCAENDKKRRKIIIIKHNIRKM